VKRPVKWENPRWLIACCRNRGISQLLAEVLQQNARMLRLAKRFGFRRQDAQFGTVRLVLELRPAAGASAARAFGRETQPTSQVTSRRRAP
jgi:L-amino acid N-acyltransferase YncA